MIKYEPIEYRGFKLEQNAEYNWYCTFSDSFCVQASTLIELKDKIDNMENIIGRSNKELGEETKILMEQRLTAERYLAAFLARRKNK